MISRLGNVRLIALMPTHLDGFYADLLTEGRADGRGGLSPKTVRNVHIVLHEALSDAAHKELIPRNPASDADPPRSPSRRSSTLRTWNPDELARFLYAARGHRLFPAYRLMAMTGLRRSEALGLMWDDIDLGARQLAVRRTWINVANKPQISNPKTPRSQRRISLDPETVEVLGDWRRRQVEERLALGPAWEDSGFVFTKEDGRPLHPDLFSKQFTSLVRRSGVPTIRLHDLRHTHATLGLRAGVHPKVMSDRLGHSSVAFTLDTYSDAVPPMEKDAADRIARLVFPAM